MSDLRAFAQRMKALRKARDVTQEALARQVGCAQVTIKKIEAGALRPSRQIAERLAEALGLPADERPAFVALARDAPGNAAAAPVLNEQQVRGYLLRERLGVGGFGVVYRAAQPTVQRDVAIKIIAPEHANRPEFIRRFEIEAQTVARLEHPHIVPLYDYWRDASGAYLVMRWIRGGALSAALQRGPWALPAAARLIDQIGAALTAAHRQGVIHRDVKPANVLLDEDGNAYLADFGIAKHQSGLLVQDHTQAGVMVGSPEYLAPEQLCGEPITPQTDIYSLGVLLYEVLAGAHPLIDIPAAERVAWQFQRVLPPLRARRPDLPGALDTVVQRATARDPRARYGDVPSLVHAIQQIGLPGMHAAITPVAQTPTATDHPARDPAQRPAAATLTAAVVAAPPNPYKGLRSFQEADAPTFFGRAALTARMIRRLAEDGDNARALVVVGPSGSGKSSVVRAGLVPALRRGALPTSEGWFITTFLPGAHPLEELEAALLRVAVNPPDHLLGQLGEDERGLLRAIKRVLPDDSVTELVLIIDQFEELFTLTEHDAERIHLLRSLLVAVQDERSRLRLIVTLRADFFDRPLRYEGWDGLLQTRTEVVTLLTADEISQTIIGPAQRVGLVIEPGLVEAIIQHVREQPGALPLLQYALTELFDRRDGRMLTQRAYEEVGGVAGALARRAEALYAQLDPYGQAAARQIFLRLVSVGDGADDTRRRVLRDDIPRAPIIDSQRRSGSTGPRARTRSDQTSVTDAVVEQYGAYRLLTFDRDPVSHGATVEVAHEVLIRSWDRLREWLSESRANLRVQQRLAVAAAEWRHNDHDPGFLASGARLAHFEALLQDGGVVLNTAEHAYVQASLAERERRAVLERQRQEELRANLARADALHLAAESRRLAQVDGSAEVVALLALRSIRTCYTPQGDEALTTAATRMLPQRRFIGHAGPLWGVGCAPDGRFIVTASQDQTARLWDVETGQELRRFVGHTDVVYCVAYARNGLWILTGSYDRTARVWDAQTGELCGVLTGHTDIINRVAISADGRTAVTASTDLTAIVWDLPSGTRRCTLRGHTGAIWGVALGPDATTVITGSWDRTARIWDAESGVMRRVFSGHDEIAWGVALSPDGQTAASCDTEAHIWDTRTGNELRRCSGHADVITSVTFSPDGRFLLTGAQDRTARLWDVATGREIQRFVGHTAFVWDVAFMPDGQHMITASYDKTALLWTIEPQTDLPYLRGHTGVITRIQCALDRHQILTASVDRTARIWDRMSGQCLQILAGHTSEVSGCAWSPDSRLVITGSRDRTARVWDAPTGAALHVLSGHTRSVTSVAFTPDSRVALTGGEDYTVRVWDVGTGIEIRTLMHGGEVFAIACAHQRLCALTGATDGAARLWDINTGEIIFTLPHPNGASAVAIAPDDRMAVTGGWDGSMRLWDLTTGEAVGAITGHNDVVWHVAFAADGRSVLSSSADRTVRLWDAQTGQELRRFGGPANNSGVALEPSGRSIVMAVSDNSARRWPIDVQETVRALCGRLLRDFTPAERAQYAIRDDSPTCGEL